MSNCGCRILLLAWIFWIAGGTDQLSAAADWGSIKGRVIVENNPPKRPMINAIACGVKLPDETLILGTNNELANAVVYLRVGASSPAAVHPQYETAIKKPLALNHKGSRFVPHIVVARKGQTIDISNSDAFAYNTNIPLLNLNKLIPPNGSVPVKVDKIGSVPMPVFCNIHPWMKCFLLALDHPYAAVTGNDGTFEIKNVPAGEREFQFWHESGYLKNGRMKAGVTDQRGRIKLDVQAGETLDLGDIKVRI